MRFLYACLKGNVLHSELCHGVWVLEEKMCKCSGILDNSSACDGILEFWLLKDGHHDYVEWDSFKYHYHTI